jgi:hypothetical protein
MGILTRCCHVEKFMDAVFVVNGSNSQITTADYQIVTILKKNIAYHLSGTIIVPY